MVSNSCPEGRQNSRDNLFGSIPVGKDEASLVTRFLDDHDLSPHSRRAVVNDLRKFAAWFGNANREPFVVGRVTARDVADFREAMRKGKGQAVATVSAPSFAVTRWQ